MGLPLLLEMGNKLTRSGTAFLLQLPVVLVAMMTMLTRTVEEEVVVVVVVEISGSKWVVEATRNFCVCKN